MSPAGRGDQWVFGTHAWQREHGREGGEHNADSEVVEETVHNVGAYVMGRKDVRRRTRSTAS